jgi:hypothetical protein
MITEDYFQQIICLDVYGYGLTNMIRGWGSTL